MSTNKEINSPLPQDKTIERLVLGTIMSDRDSLTEVNEILTEECFYNEFNKKVFRAIKDISGRGDRPDFIAVSNEMRKHDESISAYEITLISQNYTHDLYQHAAILYDKSIRRKFYEVGQFMISNTYSEKEDIVDVLSQANDMISGIFKDSNSKISTIKDAIEEVYRQIDKNLTCQNVITGTPTGFPVYDKKSGGFQSSDLIIIAGDTSQGKTSFTLSLVRNMAQSKAKIAMYSLEMKNVQLASRLMSMESTVSSSDILYSPLQNSQIEMIEKTVSRIMNTDIYFDDRSSSNIDTIIGSIRSLKLKYGIQGAVIDYLQVLNVNMKGSNKEQQMGDVARRLKNLAKELDIWIIALSQLNRDTQNPTPSMNRLRDSGQIAEAADVVMFVYRPEIYGKGFPDQFKQYSTEGTALIDVAKGRNIGTFKFMVNFDKLTTHFTPFTGDLFQQNIVEAKKEFTDKPF